MAVVGLGNETAVAAAGSTALEQKGSADQSGQDAAQSCDQ